MAEMTAHAPDISCEGCAQAIQRALGRLDGVRSVSVDVPFKQIKVDYDEGFVDTHQVLVKLSHAGYDSVLKE
jgi:copper chaperone CopZ